jgi:hypothetical protein
MTSETARRQAEIEAVLPMDRSRPLTAGELAQAAWGYSQAPFNGRASTALTTLLEEGLAVRSAAHGVARNNRHNPSRYHHRDATLPDHGQTLAELFAPPVPE